jgi:hypothetical protein
VTTQKQASLRCCASCQWIFKFNEKTKENGCPKCGFGHYGARFALGDNVYRWHKTQKPWLDQKMDNYAGKLYSEINKTNDYIEKDKFTIGMLK